MPFLPALVSFAASRVGLALFAAALSFGYGYLRASRACAQREALSLAAWQRAQTAELARQAKAAEAIAQNDWIRAEAATKRAAGMQSVIDELKFALNAKKDPQNVDTVARSCTIDDALIKRVRRIDAAAGRKH